MLFPLCLLMEREITFETTTLGGSSLLWGQYFRGSLTVKFSRYFREGEGGLLLQLNGNSMFTMILMMF